MEASPGLHRVLAATRRSLIFALPPLLFLLVFEASLDYGFVWTDQGEIVSGGMILGDEPLVGALWQPMHPRLERVLPGTPQPYYRPLQVIVVNLVDRHFGRAPAPFRIVSFALGALGAALFTGLAWVLCGSRAAALCSGCVAAVHPALIEVHVWIAGLANALVAVFLLGSWLLATLAFREPVRWRAHVLSAGSAVALAAALLSKENAAVAPLMLAALALSHVSPRRPCFDGDAFEGAPRPPSIPVRGPHFAACAAWLVPLQLGLAALYAGVLRPRVLGGAFAGAPPIGGDWSVQWATCLAAWPASLGWLVLPLHSSSSDVVRLASPGDPRAWAGAALAIASLGLWIVLMRRRQPLFALALAWIWIAFAPSSGIVPLTHARAERYLHLSLYGLALVPAALAFQPIFASRARRLIAIAIAAAFVLGLASRTRERMPDWQSDLTLFGSDFGRDPTYREGGFMLARAQFESGDAPLARETLDRLLATVRAFEGRTSYLREPDVAELYCAVNLALGRAGDSVKLLDWVEPASPEPRALQRLYYCAALSFEAVGQLRRAASIQETLVALDPTRPDPRSTLALARCHLALGELGAARRWLAVSRAGVRADPSLAPEFRRIAAAVAREARGG